MVLVIQMFVLYNAFVLFNLYFFSMFVCFFDLLKFFLFCFFSFIYQIPQRLTKKKQLKMTFTETKNAWIFSV